MPESDFHLFTKPGNSSYTGRIRETWRLDLIFFSINTKIFSVTASSDVCSQILIWPAYFVVLIKNVHKPQHPHQPRVNTWFPPHLIPFGSQHFTSFFKTSWLVFIMFMSTPITTFRRVITEEARPLPSATGQI